MDKSLEAIPLRILNCVRFLFTMAAILAHFKTKQLNHKIQILKNVPICQNPQIPQSSQKSAFKLKNLTLPRSRVLKSQYDALAHVKQIS
jgi:hypothetical protein